MTKDEGDRAAYVRALVAQAQIRRIDSPTQHSE